MPSHLQDKISADQHISFYAGKLASSVWTNEGSVNLPSKVEWVKLSLSVCKFLVQGYNNRLHFCIYITITFGTLVSGYKYYVWYTG